jgi:HTH-type transcriptional regulator / antitoxin HigA
MPLTKEFNPDWATHPGEHLAEYMELLNLDAVALSMMTALRPDRIEEMLECKGSLTWDEAAALEDVFGLKAGIWMGLQKRWQSLKNS